MKQAICTAGLAALCLTWAASAAAQPTPDHLKCYKVKDPAPKTTYTADLGGLVAEHGCKIEVPAKLECVTTSATNVSPTPPGGGGSGRPNSFTCYKVRCPPATVPTLPATDQFGTRTVTVGTAQLLCAPKGGPTDGGFPATGQTTPRIRCRPRLHPLYPARCRSARVLRTKLHLLASTSSGSRW